MSEAARAFAGKTFHRLRPSRELKGRPKEDEPVFLVYRHTTTPVSFRNSHTWKLVLTWGIEALIMAGKGIGFKFPLAPGSVAAELGASSEPQSRLVGYSGAQGLSAGFPTTASSLRFLQFSKRFAIEPKNPSPAKGEGHRYLFPNPPAQALKGQKNARVFWLPLLPTLRAFPEIYSSGFRRISSTVTAAGQRRSFTVFP